MIARAPRRWLLLAPTAVLLAGCSGVDLGSFNLFSVQDEWKLGRQIADEAERSLELIDDAEALRLLNAMGQQLVQQSSMRELEWSFHLVRADEVNAFNIPGGHVYVNSGLVAAAENASEFMGVLAHETAHGTQRHATQQITRAYSLQIALDMALGRNTGALKGLAANLLAGGTLSHYSREAEREADHVGVRLMAAAGYDPNGMVEFFGRLLDLRSSRPGRVQQFFASHPLTETRIQNAQSSIATLPVQAGWRTDDPAFRSLKARLAR